MSTSVLILDEDIKNKRVGRALDTIYDIKCDYTTSVLDAIKKLDDMSYKVLLLDIMMPREEGLEIFEDKSISNNWRGMDTGIHVLKYLRKNMGRGSDNLKIILLTAKSRSAMEKYITVVPWKADNYYQKSSFVLADLASTISKYLNS